MSFQHRRYCYNLWATQGQRNVFSKHSEKYLLKAFFIPNSDGSTRTLSRKHCGRLLLDNKVETFLSITFTEDGGLLAKIGGVPLRRQNH